MPKVLDMSTTTPFRELAGRSKVVLPAWELRKDKEEVKYVLKVCRGVPQNDTHDVSVCLTPTTKEICRVVDLCVCKNREKCVLLPCTLSGETDDPRTVQQAVALLSPK